MDVRVAKSILWLIGFSGLGFALLQFTPEARGVPIAGLKSADSLAAKRNTELMKIIKKGAGNSSDNKSQ